MTPLDQASSSPLKEDTGKLLRASAQTAAKASEVGLAVAGKAATLGAKGAASGARWVAQLPWGRWFSALVAAMKKLFGGLGLKGVAAIVLLLALGGGAWWWWRGSAEIRVVRFEFPQTVALGETASGYLEYKNARGGVRKVIVKMLHQGGRTSELAPPADGLAQGLLPLRLRATQAGLNQFEVRLLDAQGRVSEAALLSIQVENRKAASSESQRGETPNYSGPEGTRGSSARERPGFSVTVPASGEGRSGIRFEFGNRAGSEGGRGADNYRQRGLDLSD